MIAAIYLTQGMDAAREHVLEHLGESLGARQERDFKSRLQELTQGRSKTTPEYRIVEEKGPAHARSFLAEVVVQGEGVAQGRGTTKKAAEQAAARLALATLSESIVETR